MTSYDVVTSVDETDTLELWPVYDAVFGDHDDVDAWRRRTWDGHVARAGFRLARAYGSVDGKPRLVGFAYGYTGEHGQWWTDRAAEVLDPTVAAIWLGGHFELVSLGVLEPARGRGVGRALLRALTRGLPHSRWTLMATADADDPARHLYASEGWQVVGPGLGGDQVILGRQRPTGS
ncbi:GNAT family N-acetyltransferase [Nocardioides cynanchi]|uniref:GNAT family N-acetyltransferase n=1 Tax=Nocardioides cynanchi TaxID=2558918 RepID=UPI00178608A8|nr:GNAT family N-acetyltransferase [Nocardioides cynanchi]